MGDGQDPYDHPIRSAATGRFTRGTPGAPVGARRGAAVAFLRSPDSRSAAADLWLMDLATGDESLVVAAGSLAATDDDVPPEERARRERLRLSGAGITAFSCDAAGEAAVMAVGGRLFRARLVPGAGATDLAVPGPVVDPRLSPDGTHVAWEAGGRLWVAGADGSDPRPLTPSDGATWALADFVAAEELERYRGFWWSPAGDQLLVARVDTSAVGTWWISDPAHPAAPAVAHRYPAAGTTNASVSLWLVDLGGGGPREVLRVGPGEAFEYLATVRWERGEALAELLTRDQQRASVVAIDSEGRTRTAAGWTDDCWVDVVAGTPAWDRAGRLVTVRRDAAADRLRVFLDDEPASPPDVLVRGVVGETAAGLVLRVAPEQPRSDVVLLRPDGSTSEVMTGGWTGANLRCGVLSVTSAGLADTTWHSAALPIGVDGLPGAPVPLRSVGEAPTFAPEPELFMVGNLSVAVLWPRGRTRDGLPVIAAPYGGPHAQRVMAAGPAFVDAQWWADRGYAVVIADGRGTPGVSPSWERLVRGDFAGVLEDQVRALDAVAERHPGALDLDRVGIFGWSFGGYLAALAVLDRPDRFHVGVAGAPVTEWRLYDTAYTERYLGHPAEDPGAYDRSGLIGRAPGLTRPLLFIHGLADDNVVAAHTLQMSAALLAASRPHTMLPLSNVTHMTGASVAARLTSFQTQFLDEHLLPATDPQ